MVDWWVKGGGLRDALEEVRTLIQASDARSDDVLEMRLCILVYTFGKAVKA